MQRAKNQEHALPLIFVDDDDRSHTLLVLTSDSLGTFPDVGLTTAKEIALENREWLKRGIDPRQAARVATMLAPVTQAAREIK